MRERERVTVAREGEFARTGSTGLLTRGSITFYRLGWSSSLRVSCILPSYRRTGILYGSSEEVYERVSVSDRAV